MARVIGCKVWFDWDFNGSFTEETTNLVSASGSLSFAPAQESISASSGIVDACDVELRNTAGRYSPLNSAGALYADVQSGKAYHVPMYVEATINGSTYYRIFTGVAKIPEETGKSVEGIPTVRFTCRSKDELILQKRYSTGQQYTKERNDSGFSEAQIINAWLTAAGVTSGDVTLDDGLLTIPWSWMDDESFLEDIWNIAAATCGRFYCDADGEFRYENAAHWLNAPHLTSQQTYTRDDYQRLTARYKDDELYDSISVEYSSRMAEGVALLWEPDEPIQIPANTVKTIWGNFSYPAYTIAALTYKAHSNGGADITSSVTVTATYYAQRAKLVIDNNHATLAATVFPLQITGRPLVGGPTSEESRNSTDHGTNSAFFATRGSRNRRISGNVYIQTRSQAAMIAQFLLDRHETPRIFYTLSGCPGNPQRRPGDLITINDNSVMSSSRTAYITAINWYYGGMSYTQDIDAMDAATLFPANSGGVGYFVIGTNKLGTADSLRAAVFY